MNIILIGMSGSGKTSVGSLIKDQLDLNLIDTDETIKKETGKEIDKIFSQEGEQYFRDYETSLLKRYKNRENTIFATGGGIIVREENRQLLKELGTVILLEAEPDTLIKNLKKSQEVRPLLKDDRNLKEDIEKMLANRKSIYLGTADYIIDINNSNIEQVVEKIIKIKNIVQ